MTSDDLASTWLSGYVPLTKKKRPYSLSSSSSSSHGTTLKTTPWGRKHPPSQSLYNSLTVARGYGTKLNPFALEFTPASQNQIISCQKNEELTATDESEKALTSMSPSSSSSSSSTTPDDHITLDIQTSQSISLLFTTLLSQSGPTRSLSAQTFVKRLSKDEGGVMLHYLQSTKGGRGSVGRNLTTTTTSSRGYNLDSMLSSSMSSLSMFSPISSRKPTPQSNLLQEKLAPHLSKWDLATISDLEGVIQYLRGIGVHLTFNEEGGEDIWDTSSPSSASSSSSSSARSSNNKKKTSPISHESYRAILNKKIFEATLQSSKIEKARYTAISVACDGGRVGEKDGVTVKRSESEETKEEFENKLKTLEGEKDKLELPSWKSYKRIEEAKKTRLAQEEADALAAEALAAEAAGPSSTFLRELTPDEEQRVTGALTSRAAGSQVTASIEADSVQLSSVQTLNPGGWLNDEVIHYFFRLLAVRDASPPEGMLHEGRKRSHFFKSFFFTKLLEEKGAYCYANVKRWSKNVPGKDIFNLHRVIFPVNISGMHWTCLCVNVVDRRINFFDSMGSGGEEYLNAVLRYLGDEWAKDSSRGAFPKEEWKLVPSGGRKGGVPQQQNGYDCGVFTCAFAECLARGKEEFDFDQGDVTRLRRGIVLSVLEGCAI